MSNKRLSLDAFKAKANQTEASDILDKIQGGTAESDCHGFWGQVGKIFSDPQWGNIGTDPVAPPVNPVLN